MKSKTSLKTSALLFILITIMVTSGFCSENVLHLNDQEYFETRGFEVLAFENEYTGFFFDEKASGIILIHHGVRTATGGAVRLKPTPEQWDQIPTVVDRNVNKQDNSVEIVLRYEDYDFNSRLFVQARNDHVIMSVFLDEPLPEKLKNRTGFNLEFLPSGYFEKTFFMDKKTGIFPLHPSSRMQVRSADTQLGQYAGHSTFDDRGRSEYVEPKPIAEGKTLVLAPEDPERCITIQSMQQSNLRLLDGRNVAQNGWFVVRTLIPANTTGKVVEWILTPEIIPTWTRAPMIGYSQVGYHPDQQKIAVIELDKNDTPLTKASILHRNDSGKWTETYSGQVTEWGNFYRYHYVQFDFSAVQESGLYVIQYGDQKSGAFQIGTHIYDHVWEPTLDVWFPVQMDHMHVNEAYRVWHGAAHLDDARQAPLNHQHFDGYRMGDSTETKYKPGEHIPGLNIGGWFDAGDYDIRTGSHCKTVLNLIDAWEYFQLQRDETLVDQNHRYVDIHHPDGTPDILQQIEHGTLALIAQHRAFGRAIAGIIVPYLHQYHHLGDGSTMTDNLRYNPNLEPYKTECNTSGTPDDRWAFTNRMAWNSYSSIAALASASRALQGYNDDLAKECLTAAKKAFINEQKQAEQKDPGAERFGKSGEIQASLQLYISTTDSQYANKFTELIWPALEKRMDRNMRYAIRAVPVLDDEYKKKLIPFVEKYKAENEQMMTDNPFGVPITSKDRAANETIIDWAVTNYLLHKSYPNIIGPEYTYRGINYIFGCHPCHNVSFVSGIGVRSKRIAYGNNRADFTFIAGGVVPNIILIKPDFPENKLHWPFLWEENEYVIHICANYILLANAVRDLGVN